MSIKKLIGMIHLDALPGYPQHQGVERVIEHALHDLTQLQEGGVDSILIENTDDDPHLKVLGPEQLAGYTMVAEKIAANVSVPFGFCALFNDYKAALSIAKVAGGSYVRVPVFNEAVIASSGIIEGNPYDVISFRDKIKANDVKILADVQVKHAYSLSRRPIQESAVEILHFYADELIVTGRFTGDMPAMEDLRAVRAALPNSYINIGSGTTPENVKKLGEYADAVIVGTYFKVDGRMNASRVKELRKQVS
ncbi:BtpA/SgcQ family protein [Candidatus Woesearchaeota archaeon]|nr:BtpA/SgcQ family protein [Candidatus Woesearchaeota archaeon]